jgi:hypothetical protein
MIPKFISFKERIVPNFRKVNKEHKIIAEKSQVIPGKLQKEFDPGEWRRLDLFNDAKE